MGEEERGADRDEEGGGFEQRTDVPVEKSGHFLTFQEIFDSCEDGKAAGFKPRLTLGVRVLSVDVNKCHS